MRIYVNLGIIKIGFGLWLMFAIAVSFKSFKILPMKVFSLSPLLTLSFPIFFSECLVTAFVSFVILYYFNGVQLVW